MGAREKARGSARHERGALVHAGIAVLAWRHRRGVIWGSLILAALSLIAAIAWLRVDTDPARMINPDLSFRRDYQRLIDAFPQLDNGFIVLVEGERPDDVRAVAESLTESFRARPDLFSYVLAPALSPMFRDYGPLYLTVAQLRGMTHRLKQAAPMLRLLAEWPNLEGLARLFAGLSRGGGSGASESVEKLFTAMAETTASTMNGRPRPLDWSKLGGSVGPATPKRVVILAKPKLDFSALDPAAEAMRTARRIIADPEAVGDRRVRVLLTGEAAMNAEEFSTITHGAVAAGLLSFLIVGGVVLFGLPTRRLIMPVTALIVIGFALNAGFATLTVRSLNMISVAFAVLFIGLGVDYAVHLLLRWVEETRVPPHEPPRPLARAAAGTGPALGLSAVTTALSFLAFLPTDFNGMAQLGLIAAGGIGIAYLGTLVLVPAVLAFLPESPRLRSFHRKRPMKPPSWKTRARLRAAASIVVLIMTAASVIFLPRVRFDGDPVNLKDPAAPSVRAFRVLLREDPSLVQSVSVLADDRQEAEKLARLLAAVPAVGAVRTALSFLPDHQTEKLALLRDLARALPTRVRFGETDIGAKRRRAALRESVQRLSDLEGSEGAPLSLRRAAGRLRRELTAFLQRYGRDAKALAALEAAFFLRLPETVNGLRRLARTGPLTVANMDPALKRWYVAPDGRWRVEAAPARILEDVEAMRRFALLTRRVAPNATGAPVEIAGAADVVARAMLAAVLLSLGAVIVVLGLVMRSLAAVLMALTPIIMASMLLMAYTVVFDAPFNFANVIVIPLLLGLGVDSAIHYVHRARELASGSAVGGTSTPRAIIVSALTTLGSFGTLWLTPHRGLSSMGELLTVAVALMLVTTLVVMPQLIDWAMARKRRAPRA